MFCGAVPFLPFVQNPYDLLFAFYVLMRFSGLFLVAPLLSNQGVRASIRATLTLFCTALMGMMLYSDYRGENPSIYLLDLDPLYGVGVLGVVLGGVKEIAVGWAIGLIFTFIFEALMIAGQVIGVLIGFSMSEILDPVSGQQTSILSQFFVLFLSILIFCLDIHHLFFRLTAESFRIIPLGHLSVPADLIQEISQGSSKMFVYSLRFAAFPYAILSLVTIGLGFMAKIMPEMNIFMVGFPLRILIGYYTLVGAISFFPLLFTEAFQEYSNLILRILHRTSGV